MQKRNWGCQVCAWASETKMSTNIALMHEKQMIHSSHLTGSLIRPVGPLCWPRILARVPLSAPTVGHAVHAEGLVVRTSYRVPAFILHVYHVYLAAHRMLNHAYYSKHSTTCTLAQSHTPTVTSCSRQARRVA